MNYSNCSNCSTPLPRLPSPEPPPYGDTIYRIILIAIHTFIFVAGLFGNLFVVTVILRRKKMRTVTNWFVFNLALSDLAIVILVITSSSSIPFFDWPFGEIACRYLIPVLEHFAGVCVLTHTALSIARYIIVQHSMKGKTINLTHVKIVIAMIWVIAFLIMSATLMGLFGKCTLVRDPHTGLLQCYIIFTHEHSQLIYQSIIFALTYVIPMVATGFAYWRIYGTVRKSLKTLSGHTSKEMLTNRRRKSRRMNRVLMTMYIMFGITTLPIQLLNFLVALGAVPRTRILTYIWFFLVALFYAQVVTNPFVLFYMGEEYRKELYKLPICCCFSSLSKRRLRKMSHAFQTSFKGHMSGFKKRSSNVNSRHFPHDLDSIGSKTGLVIEKRISSPISGKKSYDTINGYDRYNYKSQKNDDVLRMATPIPTVYCTEPEESVDSTTEQNESNSHHGSTKRIYPNKENFQRNIGFYECLSYSLEQERRNHLEEEDDDTAANFVYFTDSQKSSSGTVASENKRYWTEYNNNIGNLNQSLSQLETCDESKNSMNDLKISYPLNKKVSRESITAYYDDGTLLCMFDSNVGAISFEHDSGRETTI